MSNEEFIPGDAWRLHVEESRPESDGAPAGVIVTIETKIHRRIAIPLGLFTNDDVKFGLSQMKLEKAIDILDAIKHMDPAYRRYVMTDWAPANDGFFSFEAILRLLRGAEESLTWRLEGNYGPNDICNIIVSAGSVETTFPVTRDSVDSLHKRLIALRTSAEKIMADTASSPTARNIADVTIRTVGCIAGIAAASGVANERTALGAYHELVTAYDRCMEAIDAATKEKEREELDRAGKSGTGEGHRGDGEYVVRADGGYMR